MGLELKQLELNSDCYDLLQHIDKSENLFINEVKDQSIEFYKDWLIKMDNWSKGLDLPKGYIKQTIFFLYLDDLPIGIGKLRHTLTEDMIKYGGNIGYAIDNRYRNKGYGKILFGLLIDKAKELGIDMLVATVEKDNIYSDNIVKSFNGKVVYENNKRRSYVLY